MLFDTEGNSGEFVELVPSELNYLGPQDLIQYFIRQTSINRTATGYIKVEIVLGRRLLGTVLTVYIPTVLLIFIAYMTNYFKPFFFEAMVAVNLTVLLVWLYLHHWPDPLCLTVLGADHNVHLCVRKPSQDIIYQDGGHLADFQLTDPFFWGSLILVGILLFYDPGYPPYIYWLSEER